MAGLRLNYDRFKRKHGVKLIDSVNCSWIVWHSVDMVWYCFVLFVSIRTEIQYVSCKTRVCPLIHCDLSFRKSSYITLNCRKNRTRCSSLTVESLPLFWRRFHFGLAAYFEHAPRFGPCFQLLEVLGLFLVFVIDKSSHSFVMTWTTRRATLLTKTKMMLLGFLLNSPLKSATYSMRLKCILLRH